MNLNFVRFWFTYISSYKLPLAALCQGRPHKLNLIAFVIVAHKIVLRVEGWHYTINRGGGYRLRLHEIDIDVASGFWTDQTCDRHRFRLIRIMLGYSFGYWKYFTWSLLTTELIFRVSRVEHPVCTWEFLSCRSSSPRHQMISFLALFAFN